jgi:glycerophosphoryl diester phosphodiesterase
MTKLTRRAAAFALPMLGLGASLLSRPAFAAPKAQTLDGKPPIIIAHRGASGERPEHSVSAHRLAIEEGADFIEPDLVVSKDGALIVRHENEIGGTTNVVAHPEFADRKTTKVVDGQSVTGWFVEDFTLAELKTLRCRERLPAIRPGSAVFNDMDPILTFQEMIDLARTEGLRVGRTIGVYPEIKHAAYLAALGHDLPTALLDTLKANGLDSREAPVFIQCFDADPLKSLRPRTKVRLARLVGGGPYGEQMTSAEGLKDIATYADGVGPSYELVVPQSAAGQGAPTALVQNAHALGLVVHPWTVRAENQFLPKALWHGTNLADHGDVEAVFAALYATGIDGLFSDFPALNVKARAAWLAQVA